MDVKCVYEVYRQQKNSQHSSLLFFLFIFVEVIPRIFIIHVNFLDDIPEQLFNFNTIFYVVEGTTINTICSFGYASLVSFEDRIILSKAFPQALH
jgi:hypothetical protein